MSVIAVKIESDKILIGSDSQTTRGDYMKYIVEPGGKSCKLQQFEDLIVGAVGMAKTIQLMGLFLETNKLKNSSEIEVVRFFKSFEDWLKKEVGDGDISHSSFLIVKDNRVLEFSDYYVREIQDYWAIGSGSVWALPVLSLGYSLPEALEAACKLDLYCSGPIKIIEIPLN
jgi:ATP-dependent protease HslVU (ClpYQ) peptidase subunit